jgi:hypothetical protein
VFVDVAGDGRAADEAREIAGDLLQLANAFLLTEPTTPGAASSLLAALTDLAAALARAGEPARVA